MSETETIRGAPGDLPLPTFRWSPWATVGLALVIALVTLVGVGAIALVLAWSLVASGAEQGDLMTVLLRVAEDQLAGLTVAQAVIIIAMVAVLTRRKGGLSRARMLGLERIGAWRLGRAVAAILVAIFLLTELPQLVFHVSDRDALKWMAALSPIWLAVVLAVVIAPLSEELLFRGFLFGGLAPSRLGPIGAIAVTSAIWAVIHVQYAWPIMVQIFVYGATFGVARWRTGSLWPSIVAHGLINLYAAIVAYSASVTSA